MSSTQKVLVFGATGAQGGSIVTHLLKDPKYKVRGVTRNVESDKAKALAARGVDVIAANLDDPASLTKAFDGVDAAFGITDFFAHLRSLGPQAAGERELAQFQNLARAAAESRILKHFVASTLPPAKKAAGGKYGVPHWDYKAAAMEWMKSSLPELYAKTTELWCGWYVTNLFQWPYRYINMEPSGVYLLALPTLPDAQLPSAGAMQSNIGPVVSTILSLGPSHLGRKIIPLVTDYISFSDLTAAFERVTGQRAGFATVSYDTYVKMWGVFGEEIASQLPFGEEVPVWERGFAEFYPEGTLVSLEELGVRGQMIGTEGGLEAIKEDLIMV